MTTQNLTDADRFELVTATYTGQRADEPEDHTDKIDTDRWTNYGHDRLYLNGLRVGDGYLDLKTGDSDGDRWTKVSADYELDGDELTIEVGNRSPDYTIVLRVHGEGFESADEDDDEDAEESEIVTDGGESAHDLEAGDELVDTSAGVLSLHEVKEVHDNGDVTIRAYRNETNWDTMRETAELVEYALGEIYVPLSEYDGLTRDELLASGEVDADGHGTMADGGEPAGTGYECLLRGCGNEIPAGRDDGYCSVRCKEASAEMREALEQTRRAERRAAGEADVLRVDEDDIITDGGVEAAEDDEAEPGVKTIRELGGRQSGELVQHYSADGTLYAYRDGNEHVVVSNGRDPGNDWTMRVPATRTAVTPGEHLWTVPANWEQRVRIKGNAEARYAIYHIPESGVDVRVSVPHNNHLVDAWYGVQSVGELTFTYADECGWDELERMLARYDDDELDEDVREALEKLHRRGDLFERAYADAVDEFAEESLFEGRDVASLNGWTVEPWGGYRFDEDGHTLSDELGLQYNSDTHKEVQKVINRAGGIIPNYPEVKVSVDDSGQLPDGFGTRALTEAGCSPPEALDYYHVEVLEMSQSEWAEVRGRDQSTVSGNIRSAKRKIKR